LSTSGQDAVMRHREIGTSDKFVHVRFELPRDADNPDWPPSTAELMWAEPYAGNLAILRSVPFYARGVAFGDLIATRSEDGMAAFESVIEHNGHSTYRIAMLSGEAEKAFAEWWRPLADLGCEYERANDVLIAVDMSPSVDVHAAYQVLEKGEKEGIWDFEEGFYYRPE